MENLAAFLLALQQLRYHRMSTPKREVGGEEKQPVKMPSSSSRLGLSALCRSPRWLWQIRCQSQLWPSLMGPSVDPGLDWVAKCSHQSQICEIIPAEVASVVCNTALAQCSMISGGLKVY